MYIDFDGHHSSGSSFDMYMICGFYYKMWVILTSTSSDFKKKYQVKSPSIWSRTPNSVRIRQSDRTGNRGVTGHSTPAVRAISEMGARQHCSAISDVCIRYVHV